MRDTFRLDLSRLGRRVTVIERAGGDLLVRYAGETLGWAEVSEDPVRVKTKAATRPVKHNKRYEPGPDYPFNRALECLGSRSGGESIQGYDFEAVIQERRHFLSP